MGVAPTGRELTNRAIVIHRIVEGKIAEEWGLVHIQDRFRAMSYGNEHETSYLRTYAF
jgi:predicted ester cyclase